MSHVNFRPTYTLKMVVIAKKAFRQAKFCLDRWIWIFIAQRFLTHPFFDKIGGHHGELANYNPLLDCCLAMQLRKIPG